MLFTYKLSPPTLADGQFTDGLADAAGQIRVAAAGSVASGGADSGNPLKFGGVFNTTQPTVTTGQRVDAQMSARGELLVSISSGASMAAVGSAADALSTPIGLSTRSHTYGFNGSTWDRTRGDTNGLAVQPALSSTFWAYAGATGGIINTTDVAVKTAAGASVRNYISGIQFKNTSATASEIVIKDGATIIWRGHVSASMTVSDTVVFNPPLRGTANTAVNVAMITTATATIVSLQGYTGA